MEYKLKQLKPIANLELFEFTKLVTEDQDPDMDYEAIITRVHGGYLYMHWYSGTNTFVPYTEFNN